MKERVLIIKSNLKESELRALRLRIAREVLKQDRRSLVILVDDLK